MFDRNLPCPDFTLNERIPIAVVLADLREGIRPGIESLKHCKNFQQQLNSETCFGRWCLLTRTDDVFIHHPARMDSIKLRVVQKDDIFLDLFTSKNVPSLSCADFLSRLPALILSTATLPTILRVDWTTRCST